MKYIFLLLLATATHAAEWQWSVAVDPIVNGETDDHPRAFLWIPPGCQRVRAVVVGQHNMEEEPLLEHPKFRAACSEAGFAEVWITPAIDLGFDVSKGAGDYLLATLEALALASGYRELATAPVLPIGHSAASGFPWRFADWRPERTLAALSTSGSWPVKPTDVPGLVTIGEYEGAGAKVPQGLKFRPSRPLSAVGENGGGHFDCSDRKAEYIGLYLKKLAQYRLNPDGTLRALDASKTGWLVDCYRGNDAPKAPAAPVGKYTGDPNEAFWSFDEELARATEKFQAYQRGLKYSHVGYVQDGKLVPEDPKFHFRVRPRFLPLEDGVSFKLTGGFVDDMPHPEGPVKIVRSNGPAVQIAPDMWRVQFYRMGMNNKKRTPDICFWAEYSGNDEYRRSVMQSVMGIPLRNNAGKDQRLTFPAIPNQPVGVRSLKLNATSDAHLPVSYYVREGPAEIEGDTLKFTALPPRSRMPVKVTVVAWQYGNAKLKTAEPVERTFNLGIGTVPALDLSPVWAKANAAIRDIEIAQAAEALRAGQAAEAAPNSIGVKICKAKEMQPTDLAGAEVRVGNWNNLKDLKKRTSTTLSNVIDKSGAPVPGLTITVTGGNAGATFDGDGDSNDARLFAGAFDQFDGEPTVVEVIGIPYAQYDVYFYRGDDGDRRAGKFKIGDVELTARGGNGNPSADGKGYVNAGNYVKFDNLTNSTLKASFTATFAGDKAQRSKVVGFQIVERK